MSLGVIVGTLSSIFVAAPIAFLTLGKEKGKRRASAEVVEA